MSFFKRCAKNLTFFSLIVCFYVSMHYNKLFVNVRRLINPESMKEHQIIVNKYFDRRKNWVTSNLGTYLFKYTNGRKHHTYVVRRKPKGSVFNVLIWKYWQWLKGRHTNTYGADTYDPLAGCSVSNCRFFGDGDPVDFHMADAVVVHLQKGSLPALKRRDPRQLWIFWTDESPRNTFTMAAKPPKLVKLSKLFNWSMTYRSDSDVPVPYGRTVPLSYPKLNTITQDDLKTLVPYWGKKRRDVLAANVMSHCVKFRIDFLKGLQRFMNIDTYGKCAPVENATRRCPGHFTRDCFVISEYLFYIVIENSKCRQYITEKAFHHAYAKGAIPIIMGAPLEDCIKLLPPKSFIHRDSFSSINDLVKEVYLISNNLTRLFSYHAWRNHFEVKEEHGFLGTRSLTLCRLCEALNYNDNSSKIYRLEDIHLYLDPKVCCRRPDQL